MKFNRIIGSCQESIFLCFSAHIPKYFGDAFAGGEEKGAGAGHAHPLEALPSFGVVNGAVLQKNFGFFVNAAVDLPIGQTEGTEIQPEEVSAFGFSDLDFRKLPAEKGNGFIDIAFDVFTDLIHPFPSFVISGDLTFHGERIGQWTGIFLGFISPTTYRVLTLRKI